MKRRMFVNVMAAMLAVVLLLTAFSGCGGKDDAAEPTDIITTESDTVSPTETDTAEPTETGRADGERFETVIILEGMEETVKYEHIINEALGFEMDYDYESFVRRTDADRERFISVYDDPDNPENYLDVTYRAQDFETVKAAVKEELSKDYEVCDEWPYELENAEGCVRIGGEEIIGGGYMAEQLQMVYLIPAGEGTYVATAHYSIEAAEGFGRRFAYLMQTFTPID